MKWFKSHGNEKDTVISSRVRFARNIAGYPFPSRLDSKTAEEVIGKIRKAYPDYTYTDFTKLDTTEARAYVERHEVSSEFAEARGPHGLLSSEKDGVSIMLCEEDHMRIQCITSGLSLKEAYEGACRADDIADAALDIAFSEKLGYLTHCPTNLGTAMRASVMMFLPAMTMHGQIPSLAAQLQKIGLTLRGLYGEGSQGDGCLYQISNQVTLGISEDETLDKLSKVISQISASEKKLRENDAKDDDLCDRIQRSEGILRYARKISSSEFLRLYADIRFGIAIGSVKDIDYGKLDEVLIGSMPANLMINCGRQGAGDSERDVLRARYIKENLVGA
ncbi:MAG: ATP--guanido phosphotransferase [Clostridia bacterium]|nr:ATP--guanido phosphotransferase [Clostridia bacterium]